MGPEAPNATIEVGCPLAARKTDGKGSTMGTNEGQKLARAASELGLVHLTAWNRYEGRRSRRMVPEVSANRKGDLGVGTR